MSLLSTYGSNECQHCLVWISKKTGEGETFYYGKRGADRQIAIYDKLSQSAAEQSLLEGATLSAFYKKHHTAVTRVEFRERDAGTMSSSTMAKHLQRLRLYNFKTFSEKLSQDSEIAKRTFWLLFQHTTLAKALSSLESEKAEEYKKALRYSGLTSWNPKELLQEEFNKQVCVPLKKALSS